MVDSMLLLIILAGCFTCERGRERRGRGRERIKEMGRMEERARLTSCKAVHQSHHVAHSCTSAVRILPHPESSTDGSTSSKVNLREGGREGGEGRKKVRENK